MITQTTHMINPAAPLVRMVLRWLIVLGAFATVCRPTFGQDKAAGAMSALNVVLPRGAQEQLALSAAPEHLRADATVYVYGKTDPTLPFVATAGAGADHGLACLTAVPGEAHQHAHLPN